MCPKIGLFLVYAFPKRTDFYGNPFFERDCDAFLDERDAIVMAHLEETVDAV